MEKLVNAEFWKGKKVLVTGHTGFKGSWLCILLNELGSEVFGLSKDVPTNPSLFEKSGLRSEINHFSADIRNEQKTAEVIEHVKPDILFHLAAQPLVKESYKSPIETINTNIMGTAHILEAVRRVPEVKACVVVTTDKCYENNEWVYGYRETDPMGGFDPYSASKAGTEIITSSYIRSFFADSETTVCTARAGNVIGGGDWAADRIVPDIIQALLNGEAVKLRNPLAIRPWQHVLEPITGYMKLAEYGFNKSPVDITGAWNFGPHLTDAKNVTWITEALGEVWGNKQCWQKDGEEHPHEAGYLKLDISKALSHLKWQPVWNADTAVRKTGEWYNKYYRLRNNNPAQVYELCLNDINSYLNTDIQHDGRTNKTEVQSIDPGVLPVQMA